MNILFVCTGNTCRSPMAEGYLKSKNIPNLFVKSCGLQAFGDKVSVNSKEVMAELSIDISKHISSNITEEKIAWANRIICMSHSHKQILENVGVKNASVLGDGIPDPYGGDITVYRQCRDAIISATDKMLDNMFYIREALPADFTEIARLEKVCFSTPWTKEGLLESFQNTTKFFVAVRGEEIVGYVGIGIVLDEGYITNVAVFPQYRRQGVATALLEFLFEKANELGLAFISLEVRPTNENAVTLYKGLGFCEEGRRKNFYTHPTEDALIMTKRFD